MGHMALKSPLYSGSKLACKNSRVLWCLKKKKEDEPHQIVFHLLCDIATNKVHVRTKKGVLGGKGKNLE